MPTLIKNNNELRKYLPNILREVEGETLLYDKLVPYLDLAENWLAQYFVNPATAGLSSTARTLVFVEAYRMAIPQLDLVLTPNGFATTGTQNMTPASRARVDALLTGLDRVRAKATFALMAELRSSAAWLASPQAAWWSGTLFSRVSELLPLFDEQPADIFEAWIKIRPEVENIEAALAAKYFSAELMAALRAESLSDTIKGTRAIAANRMRALVVKAISGNLLPSQLCADVVNAIRNDKEHFSEWHGSATAALFTPPVFRNEKKSAGYFF